MNRRTMLQRAAMTPFGMGGMAAALAQEKQPALTVDGVEVFAVKANSRPKVLYGHNWVIVRMKTDRGLTGLGEVSHSGDDDAALGYVKKFAGMLQGRSIFDIEWLRQTVSGDVAAGGEAAECAASALEHCLWDIRGKAFSVPCYEFFGGMLRAGLRQYGNINRSTADRTPDGFARMAAAAIAAGLTAVKLAPFDEIPLVPPLRDPALVEPFVQAAIERAAAVRQAIGPKHDLLVDVHSRLGLAKGVEVVQRMEFLKLYWIEEVTPAPNENLHAIKLAAKMTTAGGESLRRVEGFYPYVKSEAAGVLMPDVKVCGGMLEMKKIAALTEAAGLLVSPHGPASPVGNVIAGQVMATVPNFNILEFSYGENDWRAEMITPAEDISSGALKLSRRPGHGIVLNEKTMAQYAAG